MSFLGAIEKRQAVMQARFTEIREIIRDYVMPSNLQAGVACAVRLPPDLRGRLEEVRSRHGFRTLKDAVYAAMSLGLVTLERLEPERKLRVVRTNGHGRALTEAEVMRIKDQGFDCSRTPAEEPVIAEV